MKTTLSYLSIFTFAFFLTACGGETTQNSSSEETEGMEDSQAEESSNEKTPSGTYALNIDQSQLMWEGNMLKIGGVSLYGHKGTIQFEKGEIKFKDGNITGGMFIVDMSTINPTDDNYGEDNTREDLVGHLSSNDFFAITEYPRASFEIVDATEKFIKGNLTIRGNTATEAVENVNVSYGKDQISLKGNMTINRQKYDVVFEMPAEDKVLSDDLDFEFKVVLDKQKAS